MPNFTFNLDNFQIKDTRSVHTDTIYASLTLRAGSESTPATVSTPKSLGNLGNGTYNTGLSCPNVNIVPRLPLIVNYLIVNAGSAAADDVRVAIRSVGEALIQTPSLNLQGFTSSTARVAQEYAGILNKIFKAGSCDGLLAAEQNTFTYEDLLNYTARSPFFTQTTEHVGPRAGNSCNSKGWHYIVHWSMLQVAAVPNNLKNMVVGTKDEPDTAAYMLSQAGFGWQLKPGGQDPNKLWVTKQSISSPPMQSISNPVILTTTTKQP